MNKKSFQFDLNKCVGCHACVVACSIENKTVPEIRWREITSFNKSVYPDIPLFHYSLACNHCEDAPCKENCPALAYSRDKKTGAIIHHSDKCIGCQYCTWACPYDAPKFNPKTRIIEKCTFCNSRISNNLKPACANLCPTGALDFIDSPEVFEHQNIPGFTDAGIRPSIKVIPPKKERPQLVCSEAQLVKKPEQAKIKKSKITLAHEWPLATFTLIATVLVSLFTAQTFLKVQAHPLVFIIPGILGMFLSLFHLGKKLRAWRSILNLKGSWLSREIFFFMAFFGLMLLYLTYYQTNTVAFMAILFGVLALFSIDKVYELAIQPVKIELHSAHVLFSFFMFTALLMEQNLVFVLILVIKSAIYIYRKLELRKKRKNIRLFVSAWRLDLLISFPIIFWFFDFQQLKWWIFGSVLIGEMIDRGEYYDELDIVTPEKQLEMDLRIDDRRIQKENS